jgi:uncharacterized coiled-coil DUF342 family protein
MNTPETDKRVWSDHSEGILCEVVEASFARKLERERDEARESLKHITEYGTEEINAAVELRQKLASALVERDEAREKAERYRLDANALMLQRDEAREERDELRSEINYYRIKHDLLPISWDV